MVFHVSGDLLPSEASCFHTSWMTYNIMNTECSCWCCSACLLRRQEKQQQQQLRLKLRPRKVSEVSDDTESFSKFPKSSLPIDTANAKFIRQTSSPLVEESTGRKPKISLSVNTSLAIVCDCNSTSAINMVRTETNKCFYCEQNQNLSSVSDPGQYLFSKNGILSPTALNIGDNGLIPVDIEDDDVRSPFVDAFLHNNRLEHIVQVMGYHPQYLECFLKTQQYMLRGDGPLPYDYRHYIAIMAAGRHQCSYIINTQSTEFLLQHGDPRWLKGLDHVPKKLRDLYEFNKLMAHRPWLISKSHIEKLTRGDDTWSMSELMHAIVLLAHFHALSSFVYGCGICAEIDHEDGHTFRPQSLSTSPINGSPPQSNNLSTTPNSLEDCGHIDKLMERMRRLTEEVHDDVTEEELLQRFQHVESQSADLSLPAATRQPSPKADILRYVDDTEFTYQDFAKRACTAELPTFRAQDYSWDDHGFSLANRLYTDIGNLLDDKFKIAYNLTYYTMGDNQDVDTSSFRRAIWYYIHCMFGIRHDDYDYSEVNQLLERNLKAYVKTATCFPERVSKRDYDSFMREFKHSEKVHVNLMLFEAKLQAELLYALRAIMRHMT